MEEQTMLKTEELEVQQEKIDINEIKLQISENKRKILISSICLGIGLIFLYFCALLIVDFFVLHDEMSNYIFVKLGTFVSDVIIFGIVFAIIVSIYVFSRVIIRTVRVISLSVKNSKLKQAIKK